MKLDGELGFCLNDMGALNSGEKLGKEGCKGVVRDLKGSENDAVSVSLAEQMSRDRLWNVSEFDCSTSDDSTNANEDEGRDLEEPYSLDQFYNAKSVIECELPELVVCYKESHDDDVKDICVDDRVTSLGQILFGNNADEIEIASTISAPDSLKPEAEKDLHNESTVQTHLETNSVTKIVTEDLNPELSCNDDHEADNQLQSVQTSAEEPMSESPTLAPSMEESNNVSNKSTEDSKSDNLGNAIAGMAKAEALKDGMASNLVRQSLGESSFSAAGQFSGLITYSGPIAYSGSCSLRSDSSTTSTRSFAFPVLQAEWNSSPVRMRAADRRKQRGWRQGFLCCRF